MISGANDVGRVAQYGTVEVTDSFFLEYYSQVMHIVSNVTGALDPRHDVPARSPPCRGLSGRALSRARHKVRAMEIIGTSWRRRTPGPYGRVASSIISAPTGRMDTCIGPALFPAVVKVFYAKMYVQAGAGIVYDSDPVSERIECVNKSKALFKARRGRRTASPAAAGAGSRAGARRTPASAKGSAPAHGARCCRCHIALMRLPSFAVRTSSSAGSKSGPRVFA